MKNTTKEQRQEAIKLSRYERIRFLEGKLLGYRIQLCFWCILVGLGIIGIVRRFLEGGQ